MAKATFDQRKVLHAMLFVVTHLPKPASVYKKLSHQGRAFENADSNGEMKLSDLT